MLGARRLPALAVVCIGLVAAALVWDPVDRWWRAGRLLATLAASAEAAEAEREPLRIEDVRIGEPSAPVRARIYRLEGSRGRGRGIVVAHGVHHAGIEERRLVAFARELARAGLVVLTPELADLADYRITTTGVDAMARSVRYLSARDDLLSEERVGLLGFSFAGGLGLVAAGDPELAEQLAFVASVGGHHDLGRVLRFLVSDRVEAPDGERRLEAHEYGLAVLIYGYGDALVPEADRAVLREAVRAWLTERRQEAVSRAAELTTPEGRRLFSLLEKGRLKELGPELERLIDERAATLRALSPRGRFDRIGVPVYLLHGSGDTVIPAAELEWAKRELGSRGEALVTPLVDHVEVGREPSWLDGIQLVRFVGNLL